MRAPPLPLAPGAELRINGQLQVVRAIDEDGTVRLECPIRRTTLSYALAELVSMRMDGSLVPVHVSPASHNVTGTPNRRPLQPATRDRIERRMAYGKAGAQEFPVGPKSIRLQRVIDDVALRIGDKQPPSPHAVYRWVRRYVNSGYDTAVFMQDADVTRTRRPRKLTEDVKGRLREHIQVLLSANVGATLHGITNLALAKTAKDLGYLRFVTQEGTEELVDSFIDSTQSRMAARGTATSPGMSSASSE